MKKLVRKADGGIIEEKGGGEIPTANDDDATQAEEGVEACDQCAHSSTFCHNHHNHYNDKQPPQPP